MNISESFWRGKRVLVTGHTGFKGGWLCIWLTHLGARVHGFALAPPSSKNLFTAARVEEGITSEIGDVRDFARLQQSVIAADPEIIFHLAAQPLVRLSYEEPVETYSTNVLGTVHVLEAARRCKGLRAIVNVTTDKCYENQEWPWGYRENEPMGGHDPYSSSKGCAELVTSAYRRSFFAQGTTAVATARAGNVIGGGDWAADRLIPDLLRAFERGESAVIRNPGAIRPWQHVLEPLSGYMLLAERLYAADASSPHASAWNFGPSDDDARRVDWIADRLASAWGGQASWCRDDGPHVHEATYLKLDISKARTLLGWRPRWNLTTALDRIVEWSRALSEGGDARKLCLNQIDDFTRAAGQES